MLCGLAAVHQASVLDGLSFDPFSFQQDGLAAPEVDVSRGEIGDGLVVSQVIVVGDEGGDLGVEIAGQIVVLQKDAVLERLMPALDLALCHGVIGVAFRCIPPRSPFSATWAATMPTMMAASRSKTFASSTETRRRSSRTGGTSPPAPPLVRSGGPNGLSAGLR